MSATEYVNPDSLEQRIERLERALLPSGAADTGWVDLGTVATYAANWGPFGGGDQYRPMARRFANGVVMLRGLVAKSAALAIPETMFTLKPGWRPNDGGFAAGGVRLFYATAQVGALFAEVGLDQAGVMIIYAGSATWTSITNVAYAVAPS